LPTNAGGIGGKLVVPVRADDHQRHLPDRLRDEFQQLQRRVVSPLKIVEHNQRWTVAGEPLQQTRDSVEQAKPRCLSVPRIFQIGRGGHTTQLGEQPRQVGGVGPGQFGDLTGVHGGKQRAQRHTPRPERRRALGLGTRSPTDGQPTARGGDGDQRGLTQARLTAHQHEPRVAARGVLDPGEQPSQRPVPADK
jgi:hypothetical protein